MIASDLKCWIKTQNSKKTKAGSLHPLPPAVLRYSSWALFLKMSLFQSLNQAPFHLDHWVAIIVSGRCRSHSSWMLGQVTHTWPFSRPKPESIFPFSFSFSSPCCRDVEGAPALRLLCPANSRRVFSDRADEMKKSTWLSGGVFPQCLCESLQSSLIKTRSERAVRV